MKKKPSKFPLPEPIELAKLAAILRPEFQAAGALKVAMEFYVEAVLFLRESSSISFENLITRFGSDKRHLALMAEPIKKAVQAQWADTLELDPKKDDDPVRQYLAAQGLPLKKVQSVLDNFRRYYNSLPKDTWMADQRPSVESVIARCERVRNGEKTYVIPKFLLESTAEPLTPVVLMRAIKVRVCVPSAFLNNTLRMECRTQKWPSHLRSTSEAGMDCGWPR